MAFLDRAAVEQRMSRAMAGAVRETAAAVVSQNQKNSSEKMEEN